MNQELWRKVEEIFHTALERVPEARTAFLDEACGDDAELRKEVESLLLRGDEVESFLEIPALEDPALIVTAADSVLGCEFGPYRIVSALGAGGMGEVYRAHDSKLGRDVAIKILPSEFAGDPERLARFRREARTLASLNHPNIASIYGLVEESGQTECLVLELVEGEILCGPLPPKKVLDYARQVAEALEAAHDKGIIHRDLKPANVKVTPYGHVKVLDFGLAKALWGPDGDRDLSQAGAAVGAVSVAGHIAGTPGYMSPEQARGEDADERMDIWAFGCLMYELLTGNRAFAGATSQETIAAILEHEPDWEALPPKTPATIRELLRRCLQKDARLRVQHITDARRTIEKAQSGWNRWRSAAIVAAVLATIAIGAALSTQGPARSPDRSEWVQLTRLPDPVSQPALSPDGKKLAFIRSSKTWFAAGEIYVKQLPDGEPVQLTNDRLTKTGPAFSPDGARIAYTVVDSRSNRDTWVVPVRGGEPQRWLRNASDLVWSGPRRVLFSKVTTSIQWSIVSAEDSGAHARDIYLPLTERGGAHRPIASPDGKWVLLSEIGDGGGWEPCRVVPMDGHSPGRQVGPPKAECTSGAWSPDGRWVYLTSKAGGLYHIWRQRWPDGKPEQLTSGPTEQEGIAIAPDGRSFVTAVGLQTASIWIHDARGDRQISLLEGNAAYPKFTPDGKKLCYRIVKAVPIFGTNRDPGEVWVADLNSGRSEPLAPGFQPLDYDISPDGTQVVMEVPDGEGKARLWLAPLDRRSPPRQIPDVEGGRRALFGPSGEIFFRHTEGFSGFLYRVHSDGTGLRKALEQPILHLNAVSPDGRWVTAWAQRPGNAPTAVQAFPLGGGLPVVIGAIIRPQWSSRGDSLWISGRPITDNRSYLVPLPPGKMLPRVPPGGFSSEEENRQSAWSPPDGLPGGRARSDS